jgi:hypothetical protein
LFKGVIKMQLTTPEVQQTGSELKEPDPSQEPDYTFRGNFAEYLVGKYVTHRRVSYGKLLETFRVIPRKTP